jgi:hypothetical protein
MQIPITVSPEVTVAEPEVTASVATPGGDCPFIAPITSKVPSDEYSTTTMLAKIAAVVPVLKCAVAVNDCVDFND